MYAPLITIIESMMSDAVYANEIWKYVDIAFQNYELA